MRSTTLVQCLGILAVSWVCGCGNSPTSPASKPEARLIGVWEGSVKPTVTDDKGKLIEAKGDPVTVRFDFRADSTLSAELLFPMTGTWKLAKAEGNKLTVDIEVNMPSMEFGAKTENDKTKVEDKGKIEKEKDTLTVVFENDDQITITSAKDPKESLKLNRKK